MEPAGSRQNGNADPYANPFEDEQNHNQHHQQQPPPYSDEPQYYGDGVTQDPYSSQYRHDPDSTPNQQQHQPQPYSDDPNNSNPYTNGQQPAHYSDDPNGVVMVDGENEPLNDEEQQQKKKRSRLQKYCSSCYVPKCDFRGPW